MSLVNQLRRIADLGRYQLWLGLASLACLVLAYVLGPAWGIACLALTAAQILRSSQNGNKRLAAGERISKRGDFAEDYAEDAREEAETIRRRDSMRQMADTIETQLHGLMGKVGEQAQQMRGIADEMAQIAERSGENIVSSSMAADTSVQASRALADTTTHLEVAITLIAKQMAEATDTASQAASAGADVRAGMTQLTGRIDAIQSCQQDRRPGTADEPACPQCHHRSRAGRRIGAGLRRCGNRSKGFGTANLRYDQ